MPGRAGKDRDGPGLSGARAATRSILAASCLAALLAGCSIDYGESASEEKAAEGVPDTVAVDILHRVHKDGRLSLELSASRAVSFSDKNQTVLSNARFTAYDEKGQTSTDGRARTVIFYTDTENAEISGGVQVHSAAEKGDVNAESLYWENKTRKLTAPPAEQVVIRKDDGSALSGSGFSGDFSRRQIGFTGPVQGSYVYQPK
ncbi:MAG TPA: LPS export ABC transporter periplasmic protein LptC [Spirochaetia bacterium]|nr:LPS export ABC transporter periplasmic protein LptC [Spirochaetia bacterium]